MSSQYVVLLRGINVGGHNRVPMAELRTALSDAGFTDVATYIQSGNIVVNTGAKPAGAKQKRDAEQDVVSTVEQVMTDTFDLTIPVVARAANEWPKIVAENPFPDRVDEPKMLHVYFCDSAPTPASLENLDDAKYGSDELRAIGRHLYVFYANGTARSKLTTNELEKRLGVTTTGRNWSTVGKLSEMLG